MLTFALLLAFLTGPQGIPTTADQSGSITGVVKDAAGRPAPGIRVGAIPVPDSASDLANASAMSSLAATDEAGKYRLENIPPGRYYVAAGRVDFPTYYPGTQALARGTVISIAPKAVVDGIDFAMQDSSARVAGPELPGANSALSFSLPVQINVEGGGKLPVFASNGFLMIRLTNASNGVRTEIPINASAIVVPSPTTEFRVTIENLPAGYGVKSLTVGAADLKTSMLRLATLTFAPSAVKSALVGTAALSVTLTSAAPAPIVSGVRVTGRANDSKRRSIFLSGKPGVFYSDGTFEFRGVPAGRHTIATLDNPESLHALGASVVVGNRDVEAVQLNEVALLPGEIEEPPAHNSPAGPLRLAALQVSIFDEATHEPAGPGMVYVLGPSGTSLDLASDGRFGFSQLLPGKYSFEILVFRHATITRTVVMGDEDIDLRLDTAAVN